MILPVKSLIHRKHEIFLVAWGPSLRTLSEPNTLLDVYCMLPDELRFALQYAMDTMALCEFST